MLYERRATCPNCRNGFVSPLICGICNRKLSPGAEYCPFCEATHIAPAYQPPNSLVPAASTPQPLWGELPSGTALAPLPSVPHPIPGMLSHIPRQAPVPAVYNHGRFGVDAQVTMAGRDAEILTKMGQMVTLLHAMAAEMGQLAGFLETTKKTMRGCRDLAADLQEEIETRLGPRGG